MTDKDNNASSSDIFDKYDETDIGIDITKYNDMSPSYDSNPIDSSILVSYLDEDIVPDFVWDLGDKPNKRGAVVIEDAPVSIMGLPDFDSNPTYEPKKNAETKKTRKDKIVVAGSAAAAMAALLVSLEAQRAKRIIGRL